MVYKKTIFLLIILLNVGNFYSHAQTGLNARVPERGEILFDGTRQMLNEKWTYWDGPRLAATLPIKW